MEELYKIYDKDDIENEKEHIKISGDSCAKYIALEYEVPVCEELIIRNHEFDDMNMSPIIEDYLFVPIEWYARNYLENQLEAQPVDKHSNQPTELNNINVKNADEIINQHDEPTNKTKPQNRKTSKRIKLQPQDQNLDTKIEQDPQPDIDFTDEKTLD